MLVTLIVANLRCHSDARDGRLCDSFVAPDLICGQHSVVLLAMTGEAVLLWPSFESPLRILVHGRQRNSFVALGLDKRALKILYS